ncbi:MAG: AAC(3) family N-acetyltransferase [Defluviitaleaceae bacterium]|nr:AAC(3) family N-acetyltransferase [Defluviitaleaceae bacterium]
MIHDKMLTDLRMLGVREGGHLLVHSSYKSLGAGVEGIGQIIETLRAALGVSGTLLIPTLSFSSVPTDNRVFDIRKTPSDVGAITEYFRKMPGVVRSLHPTHSVAAIGANASEIVKDHEKDNSPVGANSPFRKLRDKQGQILMLGCGLKPNTSMHGVEELTEPPYAFRHTFDYQCTDAEGVTHTLNIRRHHFENTHGGSVIQRYDRLKFLLPVYIMAYGKVLDADCYLFEAKPMWDVAEKVMRDDPLFFVDGW